MHNTPLSEDDFKVEGHACAVTFPAINDLENGIDFQADEGVKAYMAEHYEMAITPPANVCNTRNRPIK